IRPDNVLLELVGHAHAVGGDATVLERRHFLSQAGLRLAVHIEVDELLEDEAGRETVLITLREVVVQDRRGLPDEQAEQIASAAPLTGGFAARLTLGRALTRSCAFALGGWLFGVASGVLGRAAFAAARLGRRRWRIAVVLTTARGPQAGTD